MTTEIAVVIPFYNGSEFIERAVKSVLDQTLPASEFVIVNDGSRPKEREFLHALAAKYSIKVIDQANGGQGAARNAGVAATKSPYICFLDQDDFYLRKHNETLANLIPHDDPNFGWAYADSWVGDAAGNLIKTHIVIDRSDHPKTDIHNMIGRDIFCVPSMSLVARAAFDAVEGFDSQFIGYEDDDLFVRLFRKGFTNRFVAAPVTMWCIRPESASGSFLMCRSRVRYFKKLAETFPDYPAAHRFYVRDLLIPRFHGLIVRETIDSMTPGHRLYDQRDELLKIFEDYATVVCHTPSVSAWFKFRLRWHIRALKTRNAPLIKTLHLAIACMKGTKTFFSKHSSP